MDTSLVTNPAPQAVYQTLSYPDYTGIGQKVAYQIPVPDGSYTIRLHFVEPWVCAANQRKFDIKLQGTTVRSNFDIYAAAGARYRAVALSFSVNAAAGAGLLVEAVNTMSNAQAILSGIEILQADRPSWLTPQPRLTTGRTGHRNALRRYNRDGDHGQLRRRSRTPYPDRSRHPAELPTGPADGLRR